MDAHPSRAPAGIPICRILPLMNESPRDWFFLQGGAIFFRCSKTARSLFFAAALTAPAQRFSFGVKAGAPVTAAIPYDVSPYSMVDTGRWTVGPTAEVRLFSHLSFEADALFRGYRFQSTGGSFILAGTSQVTGQPVPASESFRQNTKEWDFPLLLKYRFQAGTIHPFVDGVFEFAHASSDFTNSITCLTASDTCSAAGIGSYITSQNIYSSSVNRHGPAAGAGIEFKFGKVKISPEVRYTRLTRPNANEVTVLAGFSFQGPLPYHHTSSFRRLHQKGDSVSWARSVPMAQSLMSPNAGSGKQHRSDRARAAEIVPLQQSPIAGGSIQDGV